MMFNLAGVKIGDLFSCLYPLHGNRNILARQSGKVEKTGQNYVTINRGDGTYRTLRDDKMVKAKVQK